MAKRWYSGLVAWKINRNVANPIPISEDLPTFYHYAFLYFSSVSVGYGWEYYDGEERILASFYGNGFFAAVVDATEYKKAFELFTFADGKPFGVLEDE